MYSIKLSFKNKGKPTANIILNGERLIDCLPLRSKILIKKKNLLLPLLFNIILQVHGRSVRQENEIKDTQIEKEVRIPLFAHGMILCIQIPRNALKNYQKEQVDQISSYKISLPELVVFLYTQNEQSENKNEKTIPFTIASNKMHKNKFNDGIKFIL